jgi:hypothetical protein
VGSSAELHCEGLQGALKSLPSLDAFGDITGLETALTNWNQNAITNDQIWQDMQQAQQKLIHKQIQ